MTTNHTFISPTDAASFQTMLQALLSQYYQQIPQSEGRIAAYGIFTDADMSSFVVYYHTKAGLQDESDRWWMPEWKAVEPEQGADSYQAVERFMQKLAASVEWHMDDDKNTFAQYKRELFALMCETLQTLQAGSLFAGAAEDLLLLVQEADHGMYEDREKSLAKIMTQKQLAAYRKFEEEF